MMDDTQFELFPEDAYDALRHAVAKIGGAKKVGHRLWPHKTPQHAGEYLLACLNPSRNEKLEVNEILWLLREARNKGYHGAMHFFCKDTGYEEPKPVNKAERKAELNQQFIQSVQRLDELKKEMEKLVS